MAVMEREGPVPYREYPRMLYKLDGATCLVQTDKERDAKLAEGWAYKPYEALPSFDWIAESPAGQQVVRLAIEPTPANDATAEAPGETVEAAGTPEPVESDEAPKKRGRPKKAHS